MEKVELKVEGMTCSNCALAISKYLKNQGVQDVVLHLHAVGCHVIAAEPGSRSARAAPSR